MATLHLPENMVTSGDLEKLTRAFSNILDNAVKYNHDGGKIELVGEKANNGVTVIVTNSGGGIPESDSPVYFVDLDGIYKKQRRNRKTIILAYNEKLVYQGNFCVPVTEGHSINSFNLKDTKYGLFPYLNDLLSSYGVGNGLIEIRLGSEEHHAALTVNEYETLLMRNDLPNAIRDPLHYMIGRGKNLIQNPASIPAKTRGYAVYDLIHFYNEIMNSLQIGRSVFEKIFPYLSASASRVFRLKRHIRFMVSRADKSERGHIIQGTYQSPILLQYKRPSKEFRCLEIKLWKFD